FQHQTPFQPLPICDEDPVQATRLWNALWRIDNFHKWKKPSNFHGTIKRNYSSYEHCAQMTQSQQLSTSVLSAHFVSMPELRTSQDLSVSMIFAKTKANPKLGAKKEIKRYTGSTGSSRRKSNYCDQVRKTKKCIKPCTMPQVHPPPIHEDDMKRLQPRYPILPETDCDDNKQPFPFQNYIDTSMDVEYLRQKFGIKNEGLTQDCNTFGQPPNKARAFKDLVRSTSSSSGCDKNCGGGGRSGADDDDDDCNRPKTDCHSIVKTVHANKNQCQVKEDLDQCVITKEESVVRKEEKRYIKAKRDPCEKQQDICVEEDTDKCPKIKKPCETKPVCEESLWQKIVNFFKARPGCPSPDEWKKKALRDKAEKAAKAAGLIVCDPKDLPPDVACKCKSLPNVITTPKCEDKNEGDGECDDIEEKEECTSTVKKRTVSGVQKRCSTTAMSSIGKRCYSSKANSKALEEINKSLEEGEKKELARKIVQTVNQLLNGCDGDEEAEVAGNIDPMEGTQNTVNNSSGTTGNNKSNNVFSSNPEVNRQRMDMSTRVHLVRKVSTPHFLDVMFHDKAENGLTGYQRARAFAAFQECFSKIDAFSDINHDDIEEAKTRKLLSELDKLLDNTRKKSKKND
ncbi:unnamed protein product, partial [Callosobruchus maculatus]